jgi:hypothetical protein
MPEHLQTIHIHPQAPPKPAFGAHCNGCGVCCLAEPCPIGMLLMRRRSGPCQAVQWDAALGQYRCGAIVAPADVLALALPVPLRVFGRALAPALKALALHSISAGSGCDCKLEHHD